MNYLKIYNQLVDKCKARGLDKSVLEGYFEKHHVTPKCMGGADEDSNFVLFTPREHVIAHKLLWKSYPDNYSLMWAYTRTINSHKGVLTSREVEKAKLAKIEYMRNREISEETKEKISKTLMGHKRTPESIEKSRQKQIGQKRSKETSEKISKKRQELIASGWTMPDDAKKKIGDHFRGRNISDEHKAKISATTKGRKPPEHVRKATSEYQKSLKPWEKSAAIARPARMKVWKEADEAFEIWINNNKPKAYSFSGIMSSIHGVEYAKCHFDKLVSMFHEGWIPILDEEWVKYKNKEPKID